MKLILLHGENNYESENRLNELCLELSKTFSKIIKVDGESAKSISDLQLDFDISLFGEKKALVIKRLFQNSSKPILEAFIKYLEAEIKNKSDNTIVLWEDKNADKRTVLYKYILKNFTVKEFPKLSYRDLNNWIIAYGNKKGIKLDSNVSYLISLKVGENTRVIANEIDKLLSLGLIEVKEEDVTRYLSESAEHNIFELLETILDLLGMSSKNIKETGYYEKFNKMQRLSEKLFEDYKNYPSLIANITNNLSNLIQIKLLQEKGLNASDILSQIPMHPFVFKKLFARSNNFSKEFLEEKFEKLAELDFKFKKGELDPASVIVMIVK